MTDRPSPSRPVEHHRAKVLLVDDEPALLDLLSRALGRQFAITTAIGASAGLLALQRDGPFEVVLSDLRMPGLDGVALLGHVRERSPDTVRVLLTGHLDLEAAIAAVNEGQVFRFLRKPCPPSEIGRALAAAAEQHRLITAERVLLEQTLVGSVRVLIDLLALIQPAAFARATRVKQLALDLAGRLGLEARWPLEVAAMLSHIGCVTLPTETAERLYAGQTLSAAERAMVARMPAIVAEVLGSVPRLEAVREILAAQGKPFGSDGSAFDRSTGQQIPLGACILQVVLDFTAAEAAGLSPTAAQAVLREQAGQYDPKVLAALEAATPGESLPAEPAATVELPLGAVEPGMVFAENVRSSTGTLLIPSGQAMTLDLAERIANIRRFARVCEPVRVHSAPNPGV